MPKLHTLLLILTNPSS